MTLELRPDPDALLKMAEAETRVRGKLRVFLGMSAGVGKTFAMLRAGKAMAAEGKKVVIGVVETHGRKETMEMAEGLPIIPKKKIKYKQTEIEEFDLEASLKAAPEIILIDELAHTNAPESYHHKRYQDVLELLDKGIHVYTTLNVQHLESRKDLVEQITGIKVHETVPDSVIEEADQLELVDITPSELLKRLQEGKVYLGDKADRAAQNFFKLDYLTALREIALRLTAEKVDHELQVYSKTKQSIDPWPATERLLAAVSHSPHSEKLIRTTRRLAYTLGAPWVAVYVDTGDILSEVDQKQLSKNLQLARELGAEVVTQRENDVVEALHRVAIQKNVTQIVVGRPVKGWFTEVFQVRSLLDRLIKINWKVDIHVIRQESSPYHKKTSLFWDNFKKDFFSYWNTLWLMLGISVLCALLEPIFGYQAIGFIFLLGVLTIGFFSTPGPVVLSALISAATWNFFFIPPRYTFAISAPSDVMMCLIYFVVAAAIGLLTQKIRRHEKLIQDQEEENHVLFEITKDISEHKKKEIFIEKIILRLNQVLKGSCSVIMKDDAGKLNFSNFVGRAQASEKEKAVAQWVFDSKASAGWSTETLSQAESMYVPLFGNAGIVGVFVYQPDEGVAKLSINQETLLFSVCRQIGVALEKSFDEDKLQETEKIRASEKLYQTLLNSVSHEIRTPLTAIMGAASVLTEDSSIQDVKVRSEVSEDLLRSCGRLNQVVENLLDMSRLSGGKMQLKLDWHDIRDLVGVVLSRQDKVLSQHPVRVSIAENIPLVEFDYRLFEHVLSNLLINAATYSPVNTDILLTAKMADGLLVITVEDEGPGIPEGSLPHVFEKFYRVPGTPAGGTGLGLSIVQSIVELHGGTVNVSNRPQGGSCFKIIIPAKEPPQYPKDEMMES